MINQSHFAITIEDYKTRGNGVYRRLTCLLASNPLTRISLVADMRIPEHGDPEAMGMSGMKTRSMSPSQSTEKNHVRFIAGYRELKIGRPLCTCNPSCLANLAIWGILATATTTVTRDAPSGNIATLVAKSTEARGNME